MFGNQSKPSKIYSYGCLEPIQGLEIINDQMRAGHEYGNQLVRLELDRRQRYHDALVSSRPEIASVADSLKQADEICEGLTETANAYRVETKKKALPEDMRMAIKQANATRKLLRDKYKALAKEAVSELSVRSILDQSEARHAEEGKRLYAECPAFWGTRLVVMQSASKFKKGRPPKFKRWRGEGRIAIQLQKGISAAEAMLGDDTFFRIVLTGKCGRGKRPYAQAWVRVGSIGRNPKWAVVPFVLHRPIPSDGLIKWVYLHRLRCGTRNIWKMSVVISRDEWPIEKAATTGEVAIDIGWKMAGEDLLVAAWKGSDGTVGDITIPNADLQRWHDSNARRSVRDQTFNANRDAVASALPSLALNEKMVEATSHIGQWRSPSRLHNLFQVWSDNRVDGDDEVYEMLKSWHFEDNREWNSEAGQRARATRWREDYYRNKIAKLRAKYRTAIVRETDYAALAKLPKIEDSKHVVNVARRNQRIASPGRLVELIKEGFAECEIIEQEAIPSARGQACNSPRC